MRNIPLYPADTTGLEAIATVTHGGKDRKFHGLSLTRDLPSSFHSQVVGVGGGVAAEGSVEWAALENVIESYPTAFTRRGDWPPRTRDGVKVAVGYRDGVTIDRDLTGQILNGMIEDGSGDPLEGHRSGIVDYTSSFDRKLTLPPLQATMPPIIDGGSYRNISLHPTFFTDYAARVAGHFATPPRTSGCVLSATLMGSAWPEQGTVTYANRSSTTVDQYPSWPQTAWGRGAADANLLYTPTGDSRLIRPMEVTCMAQVTSGSASVGVQWSGLTISLVRTPTQSIATVSDVGVVCTLNGSTTGPVAMRVEPSAGLLRIILRDANGNEASGSVTVSPSGNITSVNVLSTSTSAIIGGVQVSFPDSFFRWYAVGYTRSAYIGLPAHNATLAASPPFINVSARSIIDDQARAELAAWWADEDGNFQWRNRNDLLGGPTVARLTTSSHVHSLQWEEDFAGVSSAVEVVGRKPEAINRRKYPSLEVWRSSYGSVEADGTDEPMEEMLHPDGDADWIMVDTGVYPDAAARDKGYGSEVGLYYFFENGKQNEADYATAEGIVRPTSLTANLRFVDHRTYKLAVHVGKIDTSTWERAEISFRIPDASRSTTGASDFTRKFRHYLGKNLPVLRARATTGWIDVTYTANTGVLNAPILTHDVGPWVQNEQACQAIADFLASQTKESRPFLRGVGIVPDPRLQRGDIITISDPGITGVEFKCLIVGIQDDLSPGGEWDQSLTLRILDYTRVTATLGELDQAWAGNPLSAFDAARTGETLAQFDAQPLKGAPA